MEAQRSPTTRPRAPGGSQVTAPRRRDRLGAHRHCLVVRRHRAPDRRAPACARPASRRAPGPRDGVDPLRYVLGSGLVVTRADRAARREFVEGFNAGTTPLTVTVATARRGVGAAAGRARPAAEPRGRPPHHHHPAASRGAPPRGRGPAGTARPRARRRCRPRPSQRAPARLGETEDARPRHGLVRAAEEGQGVDTHRRRRLGSVPGVPRPGPLPPRREGGGPRGRSRERGLHRGVVGGRGGAAPK